MNAVGAQGDTRRYLPTAHGLRPVPFLDVCRRYMTESAFVRCESLAALISDAGAMYASRRF